MRVYGYERDHSVLVEQIVVERAQPDQQMAFAYRAFHRGFSAVHGDSALLVDDHIVRSVAGSDGRLILLHAPVFLSFVIIVVVLVVRGAHYAREIAALYGSVDNRHAAFAGHVFIGQSKHVYAGRKHVRLALYHIIVGLYRFVAVGNLEQVFRAQSRSGEHHAVKGVNLYRRGNHDRIFDVYGLIFRSVGVYRNAHALFAGERKVYFAFRTGIAGD